MVEANQIIHGDCLRVLKEIPNCSVDLVLTDPPYGDNCVYGYMNKSIQGNEHPLVCCSALAECYRVLRRNKSLYCFTNWKHLTFLMDFVRRYTKFKVKHVVVWKKHNIGMGYAFRHQYELILVLEKGKPKYNLTNFSNVQEADYIVHNKDTHPHQKPLDLLRKIIKHSSKEGDLVLDPFAGSGATCKAAGLEGREWLGVEIEERWVQE